MLAMYASMQKNTDERSVLTRVYDAATRDALSRLANFLPDWTEMEQTESRRAEFAHVEILFSTWGMASLTKERIAAVFPQLKAVFYAAGSVQYFARAFLESGIRVFSAADANAIPVIEYTLAQIALANKGFFQSAILYSRGEHGAAKEHATGFHGNYGGSVGILGAGKIGGGVAQGLSLLHLRACVFDPFIPQERLAQWGAVRMSLEEIFESCPIVSNHLANNDKTKGMLAYDLFRRMPKNGVFLNTGRGAQVVEEDLVRALREEPGRTAILDVTEPEPVMPGHPFYQMDNVILTPHIAGSAGDETARMGAYMLDAFTDYCKGSPSPLEVTLPMLDTMA